MVFFFLKPTLRFTGLLVSIFHPLRNFPARDIFKTRPSRTAFFSGHRRLAYLFSGKKFQILRFSQLRVLFRFGEGTTIRRLYCEWWDWGALIDEAGLFYFVFMVAN